MTFTAAEGLAMLQDGYDRAKGSSAETPVLWVMPRAALDALTAAATPSSTHLALDPTGQKEPKFLGLDVMVDDRAAEPRLLTQQQADAYFQKIGAGQ